MMRFRKITALFLFMVICQFSEAQSFDPFKLDNVVWDEYGTDSNQPPNYFKWYYKICGDTIHNSTLYKKLYYAVINVTNIPPWQIPPPTYGFYGFFRQDTLTKSNYLWKTGLPFDSLLCSYDLQVSDTLKKGTYASNPGCGMLSTPGNIVLKTDTILVGNKKFKILYTDTIYNPNQNYCAYQVKGMFLVEGLGHSYGSMFDAYCPPFEAGVRDVRIYFDTVCTSALGINEPRNIIQTIINPVPAHDQIRITSNYELGKIRIYNGIGGLLKEYFSWKQEEQIDVRQLPVGIYTVLVQGKYYKVIKE